MIRFILYFAFSISVISLHAQQANCVYISEFDSIKSIEKLIRKCERLPKKSYNKAAKCGFVIASRMQALNDSACQKWYSYTIDVAKNAYARTKKADEKMELLYITGMSYFHKKQYYEALVYLRMVTKCRSSYTCAYYYKAQAAMQKNEYQESLDSFNDYVMEGGKIPVEKEIGFCKQHL